MYPNSLNLFGAGNGDRTRDPRLGKPMLYQLSYARLFLLDTHKIIETIQYCQGGAARAKAHGPSTCFRGACLRRIASPLLQGFWRRGFAQTGATLRSIPYYAPSELRRVPSPHSSTV
jgi:hypothetical protein